MTNKPKNPDLTGRWSPAIESLPEIVFTNSEEIYQRYLYLETNEISCSGVYTTQYIGNKHPSKCIKATVKTVSQHAGSPDVWSKKEIEVKPGKKNIVALGCTGFDAGSSGVDTKHYRSITSAKFC